MDIADILKIRERGKGTGYVLPTLYEQIVKDAMVSSRSRRTDVFHPSELCFGIFCPREWVLCQMNRELYARRKFSLEQQKRFDVGHIYHSYIQEKFGNANVLFGMWKCLKECDKSSCVHIGFKPDIKSECEPVWRYKEPTAYDDELQIYGNTDGILFVNGKKYILEFKTMNSNGFSTLCAPVYNHREQALWYLDIISRKGFKEWNTFVELMTDLSDDVELYQTLLPYVNQNFDGAVIVYVNKDTQDYREYFVDASLLTTKEYMVEESESLHKIMADKKKLMKEALVHLKKGTLPHRLYQCDDPSARRAKICIASKLCFKED